MPSPRPRTRIRTRALAGLAATVLAVTLLPNPGAQTALAAPSDPERQAADAASGSLEVDRDSTTGRVEFVRVTGRDADLAPSLAGRTARSATAKADSWLEANADLFGVAAADLSLVDTHSDDRLGRTLTYAQSHHGVPVLGARIKVNLDAQGDLTSVNGHLLPDVKVDPTPRSTASAAQQAAMGMVRADPPGDHEQSDLGNLEAEATLVVYETGSTASSSGIVHLAWSVDVLGAGVREQVVLADVGLKPLNRWSRAHGLTRETYTWDTGSTTSRTLTWQEGQSTAGLSPSQLDALQSTAETYHLFNTTFGRDSWDGAGATMVLVDNLSSGCPNAFWNGSTTQFCPGVESDDVVAHEWAHAYTERSSGLIYQFQSGALNESYSDVWGEVVDQLNQREDSDEDLSTRTGSGCLPTPGRGASMEILSPRSTAGTCSQVLLAQDTLPLTGSRTATVVAGYTDTDGGSGEEGSGTVRTTDGCLPLSNAAALKGKWAYLDRGSCTFALKAEHARRAGAVGVVFGNNQPTPMTAFNGAGGLPALLVSQADGARFRQTLGKASSTVVITGESPSGARSSRWLVGEKAGGMGGPLRDMWNPRCTGDPAAVPDAEYHCGVGDNGGVHLNSGVPNRAFSLFVDGGTFEGRDVTGVGLDRAAHVWWRAQTAHLVPTSDFVDFADALRQSCTTLVGQPIEALSLTADSAGSVTPLSAADCDELDTVIEATGLRTSTEQRCNLAQFVAGEPAGCGEGTHQVTLLDEDFDAGATGWGQSVTAQTGAEGPRPWSLLGNGGSDGSASLYKPTANACTTLSHAGRAQVTAPAVTIPALPGSAQVRLRFRHRVMLESYYDGAQVRLVVDGTERTVPDAAWLHNGPTVTVATQSSQATRYRNPLEGQRVWSGHDPRAADGGWGVSVLDLTAAGVPAGASVAVRFVVGEDACAGGAGWLVDDVSISYCAPGTAPQAHLGTPSRPGTENQSGTGGVPLLRSAPSVEPLRAVAPATGQKPSAKKASKVRVTASRSRPRRGSAFTLVAKVPGAKGGRVTFSIGGTKVGGAKVVRGRATLKVRAHKAAKLSAGRQKVRATFSGTAARAPARGTTVIRLRR